MAMTLALGIPAGANTETVVRTLAWAKALEITALEVDESLAALAAEVLPLVKAAGVRIACVNSGMRLNGLGGDGQRDFQREGIGAIHAAADLGAEILRVWGFDVARGQSRGDAIRNISKRLATLGSVAADQHPAFGIALENGGSFVRARELWTICELALPVRTREVKGGERLGLLWDVLCGLAHQEDPSLAVPTLNTRILYGRLGVENLDSLAASAKAEDGRAKVMRSFLHRMRGIGFGGVIGIGSVPGGLLAGEPTAEMVEGVMLVKQWAGLVAVPKAVEVKPAGVAPAAAKPVSTPVAG